MKISLHAHESTRSAPGPNPKVLEFLAQEIEGGIIEYDTDEGVIHVDLEAIQDETFVEETFKEKPWLVIHNILLLFEDTEDVLDDERILEVFDEYPEVQSIDDWYINVVDTDDESMNINDLNQRDDGSLVTLESRIDLVSQSYGTPQSVKFECLNCGNETSVNQDTLVEHIDEPDRDCVACESRKWSRYSHDLVDKKIVKFSDTPGSKNEPESILGHVYEPLLNDVISGDRVKVTGIIRNIQQDTESKFERELVVTGIESKNTIKDITLTDEDIDFIENLTNDEQVEEKLVESIAPSLVGIDEVKRGALYSMASRYDVNDNRGQAHMLMMGDPSSGKTYLLKFIDKFYPVSEYASLDSATGVGLTASVQETEIAGWSASAGKLVYASDGVCAIDEMDKFSSSELSKLHTALQDGYIPLDKADIHTELKANAIVVAAANPEDGKFDQDISYRDQFDFPPSILSRMDLVYIMTGESETKEIEEQKTSAIINQFRSEDKTKDVPVTGEMFTKYMYYINKIETTISDEAAEYAKDRWLEIKRELSDIEFEERDLAGVMRLAISSARIRAREEAGTDDVDRAIEVKLQSKSQIEDTAELYTGASKEDHNCRRDVLHLVKEVYPDLDEEATESNIVGRLVRQKGYTEKKVKHYIQKHKDSGNIYELDDGVLRAN